MLAFPLPSGTRKPSPCSLRQPFVTIFLSLQIDGGKWSNIFSTDLSRSFNALAGLSGTVSVADPRQISLLLLLSNMSTTRAPPSVLSTYVLASPHPPQRHPGNPT